MTFHRISLNRKPNPVHQQCWAGRYLHSAFFSSCHFCLYSASYLFNFKDLFQCNSRISNFSK